MKFRAALFSLALLAGIGLAVPKAHADDECCPVADLYTCRDALLRWLS